MPTASDRITHVDFGGVLYRHVNLVGANIQGGNHTTSEWFTFHIEQFRQVDAHGLIQPRSARLNSHPLFRGIHSLTPRLPLAANCFGPDCVLMERDKGPVRVRDLQIGDRVLTRHGYRKVLWSGGAEHEVTDKSAPILYRGEVYSPQHRIMLENRWITARQLLKAGLATAAPRQATQWYGHVLLDGHHVLVTQNGEAESLLPTERALSALPRDLAASIRHASAGHVYELSFPEIRAKDLKPVTA